MIFHSTNNNDSQLFHNDIVSEPQNNLIQNILILILKRKWNIIFPMEKNSKLNENASFFENNKLKLFVNIAGKNTTKILEQDQNNKNKSDFSFFADLSFQAYNKKLRFNICEFNDNFSVAINLFEFFTFGNGLSLFKSILINNDHFDKYLEILFNHYIINDENIFQWNSIINNKEDFQFALNLNSDYHFIALKVIPKQEWNIKIDWYLFFQNNDKTTKNLDKYNSIFIGSLGYNKELIYNITYYNNFVNIYCNSIQKDDQKIKKNEHSIFVNLLYMFLIIIQQSNLYYQWKSFINVNIYYSYEKLIAITFKIEKNDFVIMIIMGYNLNETKGYIINVTIGFNKSIDFSTVLENNLWNLCYKKDK
jgi:hypothetical protein